MGRQLVEERLAAEYRSLFDSASEGALEARALEKVMKRAVKQWHVLTAHIAKREDDGEEAARLPFPLSRYFAHEKANACMRCLFDRPGSEPAIEKTDPYPYLYVCSACHDEVFAAFPDDLQSQAMRWPEHVRRNRVAERALGRPERLRAMQEAVADLSGLEREIPQPSKAGRKATRRVPVTVAPPVETAAARVELSRAGATEDEVAYTDLLFDFESSRQHW